MSRVVSVGTFPQLQHLLLDPTAQGGVAGRLGALQQFMSEVAPQFA